MRKNLSPWLHQLDRTREIQKVKSDLETDIVIVGAGVAGVFTSYFLLKQTSKRIVLIDADMAGHGASGHNAGQLTTYFERPLADIATEFGVNMACAGQAAVDSAWGLLEDLAEEVSIKTPIYRFTGYAGMTELKHVLTHLADNMIRYDGGISVEHMLIASDFEYIDEIPALYSHLYEITSRQNIRDLLETDSTEYIAALAAPKGATNSALICEELIGYMEENFKDRFSIYEYTELSQIDLNADNVVSHVKVKEADGDNANALENIYTLVSKNIVLCTNGFENFKISNNAGGDINTKFHHEVRGVVNYMSAYLDKIEENPIAISYFPTVDPGVEDKEVSTGDEYFYITRRPHLSGGIEMGLVSAGGPEKKLRDREHYKRNDACEEWAEESIDNFLKQNYKKHKKGTIKYDFCWHGLLGYTSSGIRMIGREPLNPNLMYNLGCNGVGIMPSLYGAKKIADVIEGKSLEVSIFDPRRE